MTESTNDTDPATIEMAAEHMAGDLIAAMLQEIKLLPDIWPKLPELEQQQIIDRARARVTDNIRAAVRRIASDGRITVVAELEKVTFGKVVQAVMAIGAHDPKRLDLAMHRGSTCLIVIADADEFMGGLDDAKPDPDQLAIDGAAGAVIEQAKRRSKGKGKKDKGDDPPLNTFE